MRYQDTGSRVDFTAMLVAIAAGMVFCSLFFVFIPSSLRAQARTEADRMLVHQPYTVQTSQVTSEGAFVVLTSRDGARVEARRRPGTTGYDDLSQMKTGQQVSFCRRLEDPPFLANGSGYWAAYIGVCSQ